MLMDVRRCPSIFIEFLDLGDLMAWVFAPSPPKGQAVGLKETFTRFQLVAIIDVIDSSMREDILDFFDSHGLFIDVH